MKPCKVAVSNVGRAVNWAVHEIERIERAGGPKSFGGALLFARHIEFVKAMAEEYRLSDYARSFRVFEIRADSEAQLMPRQ